MRNIVIMQRYLAYKKYFVRIYTRQKLNLFTSNRPIFATDRSRGTPGVVTATFLSSRFIDAIS